jgi:hypothetical protein
VFNFLGWLGFAFLDHSVTDTSELPNWNQQDVKKKKAAVITDDITEVAVAPTTIGGAAITVASSKPQPVYIAWNNLTYIVDIPKHITTAPPSASSIPATSATASAATSVEGKESKQVDDGQVEMATIKESDSNDAITLEQLEDDLPGKRTLLKDVYGYAKPGTSRISSQIKACSKLVHVIIRNRYDGSINGWFGRW